MPKHFKSYIIICLLYYNRDIILFEKTGKKFGLLDEFKENGIC